VRIGIRYLDWLSRQFDSPRLSTAAYNMGVRNVQKLLARNKQPEVYFNQVLGKYTRLYEETSFQAKLKDGRTSSIFVAGD
jgi:soluble lytic murein transglycosylase-like protein